jgi:hypothetical protein
LFTEEDLSKIRAEAMRIEIECSKPGDGNGEH